MNKTSLLKKLSITIEIIGLFFSFIGLIMGLSSIGASGWEALGVIYILPSIIAFIIILFDFLITLNVIKKGLIYSCISSVLKLVIIFCFIPPTLYELENEILYNLSNFDFDLTIVCSLFFVSIPSIINIIKLGRN